MGKKIRKLGGRKRRGSRKVRRIIIRNTTSPSDIKVIYKYNEGFQGVRSVRELLDLDEVTVNQKVYSKLMSKPGHLSLSEIQKILENPEGIYKSNGDKTETWFFVSSSSKVKRVVVIIEKDSKSHRLATAYMMSKSDFDKLIENMDLIWKL